MGRWRRFCAWLLTIAALVVPASALAQDKTFYLDRLYMGGAPDDTIALWRPQMHPKTRFYGQFGLGFALNPFRIENHVDDDNVAASLGQVSGAPISSQLITYMDVGTEILDRFAIQYQLPII